MNVRKEGPTLGSTRSSAARRSSVVAFPSACAVRYSRIAPRNRSRPRRAENIRSTAEPFGYSTASSVPAISFSLWIGWRMGRAVSSSSLPIAESVSSSWSRS
jgi:hypothetical protein